MAAHSKQRAILPMLFAFFVFLHAAVASHHMQHAKHHVQRSAEELEAQFDSTVQALEKRADTVKVTGVTGTVGTRMEIRELNKNADAYNLFLLGLERFMSKPKTDTLSYYQIAGIHGRPFVSWNNFGPLVNQAGFCPHGNTLFGTWHRPYLAVYEQAWFQCIQEVIAEFPSSQQQRWKNAANGLRWPYWDWAAAPPSGESSVPTLMRDKTVSVTKPSGQVTIDNPLYQYNWGSWPSEMGSGPWSSNPFTLRRPVANPTRSNNNEVSSKMSSLRVSLRDRVYGLFMSNAGWGTVSSEAFGVSTSQNGNRPDSVESIHDVIHVTVGGETGGHMYYLDLSAFDPLFWLHHTNVDRLLAMYQSIRSDTWVNNGEITHPMAQWNQGEMKNSNSPLKPFPKDTNQNYFTSNDVKSTSVLGYVYPETAGSPSTSSIKSAVNNLYGPSSPSRKRSVGGQYEGRPFREGDYNTVLSIVANKYALEGSYTIECYLGEANNSTSNATVPSGNSTASSGNSTSYNTDSPNYVGSFGILGSMHASNNSVLTTGSIPLTTALQGKEATGELKSMSPDDVEAYLEKHLHVVVVGPGGVKLSPKDMPDLHISCSTSKVTPPKGSDELPSLGEYVELPKVAGSLPFGKPYSPSPAEVSPPYPTGTMLPWQEPGYCASQQVIKYVDEAGNFLYEETS